MILIAAIAGEMLQIDSICPSVNINEFFIDHFLYYVPSTLLDLLYVIEKNNSAIIHILSPFFPVQKDSVLLALILESLENQDVGQK